MTTLVELLKTTEVLREQLALVTARNVSLKSQFNALDYIANDRAYGLAEARAAIRALVGAMRQWPGYQAYPVIMEVLELPAVQQALEAAKEPEST